MTTYPDSPGFVAGSETSREAAARLTSKEELHNCILSLMGSQAKVIFPQGGRKEGEYLTYTVGMEQGMTGDEALLLCQQILGRSFDRGTIAARFTELKADGLIIETEGRRASLRGRSAAVHVLKRYAVGDTGKKARKGSGAALSPSQRAMVELATMMVTLSRKNRDKHNYSGINLMPLDNATIDNMAKLAGIE